MRARVRYRGRVQGVGFRATARMFAADLPLTGWVRNEPDGSVTLEAEGQPSDVEALLTRIAQAMDRHIHAIERSDGADLAQETGFQIRH